MRRAASSVETPKKNLKGILVFFISITCGIFGFMLVAVVIGHFKGPLMPGLNKHHQLLFGVMALISFACLLAAKKSFTKDLEAAKNSLNPLKEKLNLYSNALVKYIVICDVPVMLSIILFLLTAKFMFQVYAAVFLGFILTMIPTRKRVAEQLELNAEEQLELE